MLTLSSDVIWIQMKSNTCDESVHGNEYLSWSASTIFSQRTFDYGKLSRWADHRYEKTSITYNS